MACIPRVAHLVFGLMRNFVFSKLIEKAPRGQRCVVEKQSPAEPNGCCRRPFVRANVKSSIIT